ncbi:transposase, partial [Aurantimonas coralicida]|uniref:transposase n=1 Tax=Aurantimonas coralicida TaxID=182270 RepID=UPI001D18A63F
KLIAKLASKLHPTLADRKPSVTGRLQRNLVERFFNRIKQMRGLATRYDRRADNFAAALKLAAVRIWINA